METLSNFNFYKDKYFLPQTLKEVIQISLENNPKIISYGLIKKASFLDISVAAIELLPKVDLNECTKSLGPNTFFNEYQNFKVDLV